VETAYPLTEEQIASYRDNGYVQLLNVLTPDELAQARASVDEILGLEYDDDHDLNKGNPEARRIFVQKVNMWQVHEGLRRYVLSPKLAEIARRLAGAHTLRLWHDHALVKMPGDSRPSHWHQDLPYWPMVETGALSCWMALDDVFEANGCMAFIPASHRFGRLAPINLGNPQDIFAMIPDGMREGRDLTPVFQPMPAGSCTFHDGRTFHYAGPNTTDRPRRAMITIYMPDDVHFNGARHVVTYKLGLQPGDVIAGEVFPVLAGGG
jgi:ectoine hydroxylase-related dioxygenase (phytanoyl-CoA dioxygenase family)